MVRRAVRDRMLPIRDVLLPLALVFGLAGPLAGQLRSNVATVQLYAVSSPGARLEPLAASDSGARSGQPFGLVVNRPFRLQLRWFGPPRATHGHDIPLGISSGTGVDRDRSPDRPVMWVAEGLPGAVPLGALRDSLVAAGFGGAHLPVIAEVAVVPLL